MEIFSNLCGLLKISELYFHVMRFHETSFVNFLYPPSINRFKISYEIASSKIKNTPLEKISTPMYHSFRAICYCELVPNDLNFLKFHHIEVIGSQLNLLIQLWSDAWLQSSCRVMAVGWANKKLGSSNCRQIQLRPSCYRKKAFV